MWPFNKFKNLPFTHNPEDFKLRIVPSWFSKDYVELEYSANGGKTWKRIYCAAAPFFGSIDYDWKWEPLHYRLGNGDFTYEKEKFSSYQKIIDFEKSEEIRYQKGVEEQKNRRVEASQKIKDAYKKANS